MFDHCLYFFVRGILCREEMGGCQRHRRSMSAPSRSIPGAKAAGVGMVVKLMAPMASRSKPLPPAGTL